MYNVLRRVSKYSLALKFIGIMPKYATKSSNVDMYKNFKKKFQEAFNFYFSSWKIKLVMKFT